MEDDQYLHEREQHQDAPERAVWLRFICAAVLLSALAAAAHTLPVSYLRLVPEADYLHLELVFNPFELSFVAEVDDNKDNELDPGELQAHGQVCGRARSGRTQGQRGRARGARRNVRHGPKPERAPRSVTGALPGGRAPAGFDGGVGPRLADERVAPDAGDIRERRARATATGATGLSVAQGYLSAAGPAGGRGGSCAEPAGGFRVAAGAGDLGSGHRRGVGNARAPAAAAVTRKPPPREQTEFRAQL